MRVHIEEPESDERGTRPAARAGDGPRKRLFAAGRLTPDASRIRFGSGARAPVAGPWTLDLVVRSR